MRRGRPLIPGALAPDRPVPGSGEMRLRVRYVECDPMGVAHHSACVPWLEEGRTELLRSAGVSYAALEHAGVFLVVTRLEVRYRRPARYDDQLRLVTRVVGGGRARIDHEYELFLVAGAGDSGAPTSEALLTASSTLACVDERGHPSPLPEWLVPAGGRARRPAPG